MLCFHWLGGSQYLEHPILATLGVTSLARSLTTVRWYVTSFIGWLLSGASEQTSHSISDVQYLHPSVKLDGDRVILLVCSTVDVETPAHNLSCNCVGCVWSVRCDKHRTLLFCMRFRKRTFRKPLR
jgi:hypothetical protein